MFYKLQNLARHFSDDTRGSVSVEVAQVATSRLIGTEVPAEEAEAAVTAAIQGRS